MIRVVVYLSGKAECQLLETQLRQLLSRRSNEELDCRFYADPAALLAERADAICWDVTDPAGLAYLAAVRTAGREAFLLVMAAATTSPLVYLKPELAPDSLILRPVTAEECRRAAGEIFDRLLAAQHEGADCFVVKSRDERIRVPYRKILYFEARALPADGGRGADFHRHAGKAAGNFTARVPPRPPQLCGERRQYPARSVKPKFSLSARGCGRAALPQLQKGGAGV